MQYRKLGRTNLEISEIGHGVWSMGDWKDSDDEQSMEALRLSVELGCNFYDSAWAYGSGHSDRLLGRLIKEFPDKNLIIAGKVPPMNWQWPGTAASTLSEVFPRDHVFEYTEKTLENLGLGTLHLQQFHVWDDSWVEDDEWVRTVEELKSQGLIQYFGLSLNRWQPENGIQAIKTGAVDAVQVIYNIFDQAPEDELFPLCHEMNIGVIARVPLDEGGLTGKLTKDMTFPEGDWRAGYFGPENLGPTVDRATALQEIVPADMDLPEMAIRYILANKAVSTTIVGMRKLPHVRKNIATSDGQPLSPELMTQLKKHRWDREVANWSD